MLSIFSSEIFIFLISFVYFSLSTVIEENLPVATHLSKLFGPNKYILNKRDVHKQGSEVFQYC